MPSGRRPGDCKICRSPHAEAVNALLAQEGKTAGDVTRLYESLGEPPPNRSTVYSHKRHMAQPGRDLMVRPPSELVVRSTSNVEFLQTIRDIGLAKAQADPESVSIEHALKAVNILEGKRDGGADIKIVFASIAVGQPPPMVVIGGEEAPIEGEYSAEAAS